MDFMPMRYFSILLISIFSAAAKNKRPNILFCIADDASPYFGAYGCTWTTTPAFDRIAKEGLLFKRAYTPNAKCAPSRAYYTDRQIFLAAGTGW